jgi:hypothetical protein
MAKRNVCLGHFTGLELNHKIMSNLLYIVAVILLILWAVGYVGFNAGGIVHVLLVIAIIAVLFRVIQGKKII